MSRLLVETIETEDDPSSIPFLSGTDHFTFILHIKFLIFPRQIVNVFRYGSFGLMLNNKFSFNDPINTHPEEAITISVRFN